MSFALKRQLVAGSCMGLVTRKTKPWLEAWNFQPHLPFFREGRGAGNGVKDQSCLYDEASIKSSQSIGFRELPGYWTGGGAGRWCMQGKHWSPSHISYPTHLFHMDVHLYPLLYILLHIIYIIYINIFIYTYIFIHLYLYVIYIYIYLFRYLFFYFYFNKDLLNVWRNLIIFHLQNCLKTDGSTYTHFSIHSRHVLEASDGPGLNEWGRKDEVTHYISLKISWLSKRIKACAQLTMIQVRKFK